MTTLLDSPVSMRRRSAVAAMFLMTAGLALPGTSTIPTGDAKPPALASGTLNIDSLRQMLVNMGFEPEKSGDKNFLLTITRDSYTLRVHVAMSPNDKFVWLETRFGVFPEAAKMTAILDKLMEANDANPPAYFSLTHGEKPEDRILFLQRPLDNRELTPAIMREALDKFMALIVKTAPVWDPANWPK